MRSWLTLSILGAALLGFGCGGGEPVAPPADVSDVAPPSALGDDAPATEPEGGTHAEPR